MHKKDWNDSHQAKVVIPGERHEMREEGIFSENIFFEFQY